VKLHLLDLGGLEYDEGWPVAAAGTSTVSEPNPDSPRRRVAIIAALIEHPKAGPILFDTGAAPNYAELWPPIRPGAVLDHRLRTRAPPRRRDPGRGLS
jgi:hypothetical protein